jgi:glycosyltransferase involved in cell wall biosynthesis
MKRPLRVLLVTGAYHPQISSSGSQCRAVARILRDQIEFSVLTTATEPAVPLTEVIDDVPVYRVMVDANRPGSAAGLSQLLRQYRRASRHADVIHAHGVSKKNVVVSALARISGTPLILTLHTSGQDEPDVIRQRGRLAWWAFRQATRVVSVSPRLAGKYRAAGLPADRLVQIPNGIDLERFRPASRWEQSQLKSALGLPADQPAVLFVGFFSRDKRPDILFDAWRQVPGRSTLVFVGATRSSYREVDAGLADEIRQRAAAAGVADRLRFVESTHEIERYYRAADLYVLSSRREAMPMALLESMATGLPAIATRLAGVTDTIVDHGRNGWLVDEQDTASLTQAIVRVFNDPGLAATVGAAARQTIVERYSLPRVAEQWAELYRTVCPS